MLNHGLYECRSGRHDKGIAQLERYAEAADNIAGWYFLALHLPRGRSLRGMRITDISKVRSAVDRARALGHNPLVELLNALYVVCGENMAFQRLERVLAQFEREPGHEAPSEYLRFLDATHLTWSDHPRLDGQVRKVFRRLAQP